MAVFLQDTGRIMNRHRVAAEGHHLRLQGKMKIIKRGAFRFIHVYTHRNSRIDRLLSVETYS